MNYKRVIGVMGIGLFAWYADNTPAFAQAPTIRIQTCEVEQAQRTHPFWYPFGPVVASNIPVVDGIRIVYRNLAPRAADRVAFLVNYRGDVQRIVDVGTFASNVTIDHTFGNFSGDAYLGPRPTACRVRAVRYADGTMVRFGGP